MGTYPAVGDNFGKLKLIPYAPLGGKDRNLQFTVFSFQCFEFEITVG